MQPLSSYFRALIYCMFGFFKKKEAQVKVIDKVMISMEGKLHAMYSYWTKNKNIQFIFWFDETLRRAEAFFATQTNEPIVLLTARESSTHLLAGKIAVFGEHYPIHSKEEALYKKLNLEKVEVFSSLREPLFEKFGGDKIIHLMLQLGMKEDEVIEHTMISNAIRKAQDKIEQKLLLEQTAHSQEEWLIKNVSH